MVCSYKKKRACYVVVFVSDYNYVTVIILFFFVFVFYSYNMIHLPMRTTQLLDNENERCHQ